MYIIHIEKEKRTVKRQKIAAALTAAGFDCIGGKRHDKFQHEDGRITVLGRHPDIPENTVRLIEKQTGVSILPRKTPKKRS